MCHTTWVFSFYDDVVFVDLLRRHLFLSFYNASPLLSTFFLISPAWCYLVAQLVGVSKHRKRAGCLQLPSPWETHRCRWLPLAPGLYRDGPSGKPDGDPGGRIWQFVSTLEQGPTGGGLLHTRVLLRPRGLWVERHRSPAKHGWAHGRGIAHASGQGWRRGSLCPGGALLWWADHATVHLYLPTAGGRPRARRVHGCRPVPLS